MNLDQEALGEASSEVVRRDLLEVVVASLISCTLGGPTDPRADAGLGQVDERVFRHDVALVLVALEIALDAVREIGVARLPAVAARVLPGLDPKAVLAALGLLHVDGADLRDLENA
ncbi:hypothetical protein GOC74_10900 [Halomicrobium mukohataei]|uniref:Uncharacterized protein n=1 Tax=Halomicrobium mukohataei TaxID=57705 RepID=A0A847UAK1_9EURY|nr:hypothetical protein [Halomicrobium mukohataei]